MKRLILLIVLLASTALACNMASSGAAEEEQNNEGTPTIVLNNPPSAGTVGEEVLIQSTATDSVGVARIDLQVDGVQVRSDAAPDPAGQPEYAVLQSWTPSSAGTFTLSVIAYRSDGTASAPATASVTVAEASADAEPTEAQSCSLRANTDVNVRTGPSTAYPILSVLGIGQEAPVTGHNGDRTWWQVNGNGWISAPFVTTLGDCTGVQLASFPAPPAGSGSTPTYTATVAATATTSGTALPTPTALATTDGTATATATTTGATATATATATTTGDIAPTDSDLSIEVNIKNGAGSYSSAISYPDGDTTDRVFVQIVGFDSVTTSGDVTYTLTCTGTGVENVDTNEGGCNQSWTVFYTNDSDTDNFTFELTGPGYVTWTLVVSASN